MHKAALTLLAITTLLFSTGCGNRMWEDAKGVTKDTYNYVFDTAPTAVPYHATSEIPMIEINHDAADVLAKNVTGDELADHSAVFISRFTNQADPNDQSIFGFVVQDQIADRLVQKELLVTKGDPSVTDILYADGATGDDYLGKTDKKKSDLPPRSAQLAGTYVIGDNFIYLSARLIRFVDGAIVSAHDWTIPITDNVRAMIPALKKPGEGMEPTVVTQFQ